MLRNHFSTRVRYADTDRMGYAYYANYLRWFEVGRSELFRELGMTYKQIEEQGVYLPVAEAHCRYLHPVRYDDRITIATTLDTTVKGAIKFDYRLFQTSTNTLAAEGYTKHPCMTPEGRVIRPPRFLRDFIQQKLQENTTRTLQTDM